MENKPKQATIVGGSIAGLMQGLVYKKHGYNVRILEKSSPSVLCGQAAGIRVGPAVARFVETFVAPKSPWTLLGKSVDLLDFEGNVISTLPQSRVLQFTGWTLLYRMLLDAFTARVDEEGDLSSPCSAGQGSYETGKLVKDVVREGDGVVVICCNSDGHEEYIPSDLVIAADGAHSKIRQKVLPQVYPEYTGYLSWRGSIEEKECSEKFRYLFEERCAMFPMECGQILAYHVPSDTREGDTTHRVFNWVWYETCEDSERMSAILTDSSDQTHATTVPRGKMKPEIWAQQRSIAQSKLSPPFLELVEKTSDPFVSAIRDFVSPQATLWDGKLVLAGDALALFRPHFGGGVLQAAYHGLEMERVLKGEISSRKREQQAVWFAKEVTLRSNALGYMAFNRKWPEGYTHQPRIQDQETGEWIN